MNINNRQQVLAIVAVAVIAVVANFAGDAIRDRIRDR